MVGVISIHALLAESDLSYLCRYLEGLEFLSTLSLRRATCLGQIKGFSQLFLSTLSLRRATIRTDRAGTTPTDFYPRSPCGERRSKRPCHRERGYFYPRSPCGERHKKKECLQVFSKFLSTLSLRRATHDPAQGVVRIHISIHALLAESDPSFLSAPFKPTLISIHALLAESDSTTIITICIVPRFLSTLSLRRATIHYDNYNLHCVISIHALLAESDQKLMI